VDHLGLGRRADVVQRHEARLAQVVRRLRRQPLDQINVVLGAPLDARLVLRLADRTEHGFS
jgi:hypothetical protein